MKNKRSIYFLIPLTAIIWGIILWQVFSFQPSKPSNEPAFHTEDHSFEEDTTMYELMADYQDPFLRSRQVAWQPVQKQRSNNIKSVKFNSISGLSKPTGLVYRGVITGNRNKIGLLEIGEKKMLVSRNSVVSDFEIMQVGEDSLVIEYHDKLFSYAKQ